MFFKKEEKESETVKIINAMTSSMERLHAVGGLGPALVGISVIVGAVSLMVQKLVPGLFDFLMFTVSVGVVVASIERFVSVKLATEKLRMISGLAQEVVRASISKSGRIDSAHAVRLMQDIILELWKLDTDVAPTAKPTAVTDEQKSAE